MSLRRLLLALLFCIYLACGRPASKVVGVVPKGANHIFWQTVHAGAVKAGREFGLEIDWQAPTMEIDSSRQIEILDAMINRHVAGISVAPIDRQALSGVVDRAARQGIPVAIFDSAIDTNDIVSYIATDNTEGGRLAAQRLAEVLGGKGKVALIGFMAGSASTMQREDGFEQEIRKYSGITYTGMQRGNADRAKAMQVTENILTANPDLTGIFADNESSSMGAVRALKSRGRKDIKIVAFDASDELIRDLKDGWIDSLIVQNPFKMGYESVKALALKLNKQTPEAHIDSGIRLVRRDDLDNPDVKALLFPDIQKFLN